MALGHKHTNGLNQVDLILLAMYVGDKAVNAEDQITFCDEEPAYRRKQDMHRERERERERHKE